MFNFFKGLYTDKYSRALNEKYVNYETEAIFEEAPTKYSDEVIQAKNNCIKKFRKYHKVTCSLMSVALVASMFSVLTMVSGAIVGLVTGKNLKNFENEYADDFNNAQAEYVLSEKEELKNQYDSGLITIDDYADGVSKIGEYPFESFVYDYLPQEEIGKYETLLKESHSHEIPLKVAFGTFGVFALFSFGSMPTAAMYDKLGEKLENGKIPNLHISKAELKASKKEENIK